MPTFLRRATFVAAAGVVAVALAAPAVADDGGMPPCGLKLIMVCNMLPVFADLDHDVDLTQDPHALDGITSDSVPGALPDPGPMPQG